MYRTFHLQHQQPAQKAMGALGITLRILKNLKPDPFCLSFKAKPCKVNRNHENRAAPGQKPENITFKKTTYKLEPGK